MAHEAERLAGKGARALPREPLALLAAVLLFIGQETAQTVIGPGSQLSWLRASTFFVTTLGFILAALLLRRYLAAWVVATGVAMNFLPMAAHGGLMPVAYEVIESSGAFPEITPALIGSQLENSKDIVLWARDVRFSFFSDRFFLTVPGYGPNIYSLGDFVAFSGVALGVLELALYAATGRRTAHLVVAAAARLGRGSASEP